MHILSTVHHLEKCVLLTDLSGSLLHRSLALAHSPLKLLDITSKMVRHIAIRGSQVIPVTLWKMLEQMAYKKFCDTRRIGKKTISTAHVHPAPRIFHRLENATKIADMHHHQRLGIKSELEAPF